MKVLWLASIYPSVLHPYDGDFIQRHARATALFCNVEVIHIVKDAGGAITNDIKQIEKRSNQLTEKIIYYKPVQTSIKLLDRFLSSIKYKKIYRHAVAGYISTNGIPGFIHVHMAMKAGLTALWLKRKYNVPFILSEHWGGYLEEAKPNIRDYNFIYRFYWKKIITEAKCCTFVSQVFQKLMIEKYNIEKSCVIPNVVDTEIFFPAEKIHTGKTRFIHISTMIYQKNTEAILEAFALLKDIPELELMLYGPFKQSLQNRIVKLGIRDRVFNNGEVPQEILSKVLQQADALILYSRFETFGCVLIEANACGVPVIVSDLKVFHEIVEEGVNGLFAAGENAEALAEKLKQFIVQKNIFDKTRIAAVSAEKYNFNKVGQQFLDLYNNLKN